MATAPSIAAAAAAEKQRRLALRDLLNAKYQWIDRTWDAVFWITAIFVVAGAADITRLLFAGDWDFWTDWKDPPMVAGGHGVRHYHHSFGAPVHSVGRVAVSHRRDLHLRMPFHGLVDRALLPVACGRKLSDEFRLADIDDSGGHNSRLAIDEDEEFRADVTFRRRNLGR